MLLEYQIPYNTRVEKAINYAKIHEKIQFSNLEISKAYLLRIISSPLRQLLCLKYNMPLGYSIYSDVSGDLFEFREKEEGYRKLAKNLETEGCFSIRRKGSANYLRVSFGSANRERRDKFTNMAQKLGFGFKNYDQINRRIYHSILSDSKNAKKLISKILPYFWHDYKMQKALKM